MSGGSVRRGLRRSAGMVGCLVLATGAMVGSATVSQAQATIAVPGDQPTIQAAINAAQNGGVVLVAPGTYHENLDFHGKGITVQSQTGPATTIVDGGNAAPVVTFSSSEGPSSDLKGFTLQHGQSTFTSSYSGGGVYIASSSPTVEGNIIADNGACSSGGGIEVDFSSAVIRNNIIRGNRQTGCSGGPGGGGIEVRGAGNATIVNNLITGNSFGVGGGITLFAAGTPNLLDNVIQGNSAQGGQGGGIWIVNVSDAAIIQNLITGNTGSEGAGVYVGVPSGGRGPLFVNNTVADNLGGAAIFTSGFHAQEQLFNNIVVAGPGQNPIVCDTSYVPTSPVLIANDAFNAGGMGYAGSCTGALGNNGNISADPLFVNAAGGDYRLRSGSPSISAGSVAAPQLPATDLAGKARVVNGSIDQGVFERQPGASTPVSITTDSLPAATIGNAYGQAVMATGGDTPYTWSVSAGSLPGGLQLSAATGAISGTPTATGTFTFTLKVTDVGGQMATKPFSIVVARAQTTTTLTISPDPSTFGAPVTFTATVAPAAANSLPVTGTVSFYIDSPVSPVATVAVVAGQARFTTASLGAGTHVAGALYHGDADYTPSVSTATTLTVQTALTITGKHTGATVVAAGSTVLLSNADLTGGVVVLPGGAVDVENSTIVGSFSSSRPLAIRVCGSTIIGSLTVTGASGPVTVGDPANGCRPNAIGGSLFLANDNHGLVAIGNTVRGRVIK